MIFFKRSLSTLKDLRFYLPSLDSWGFLGIKPRPSIFIPLYLYRDDDWCCQILLIIQSITIIDAFSLEINLEIKFFRCQLNGRQALGIRHARLNVFNLLNTDSFGETSLFMACVVWVWPWVWHDSMCEAYNDLIFFYLCSIENTQFQSCFLTPSCHSFHYILHCDIFFDPKLVSLSNLRFWNGYYIRTYAQKSITVILLRSHFGVTQPSEKLSKYFFM